VIRAESFAETRYPDGTFDAVIGNVPFADVRLHDPRHNRGHHSIHNHFLVKSVALTRPGGMVVALTSRFTLDSVNPAARRELMEMADLVAAVRLPTGAPRRAAGTEAVTDLLILRRREPNTAPAGPDWEIARPWQVSDHTIAVNTYFHEHPQHVLGRLEVGRGMHNEATLHVRADLDQVGQALSDTLTAVVASTPDRLRLSEPGAGLVVPPAAIAPSTHWDGHLHDLGDGAFAVVDNGVLVPLKVPASQTRELSELLGLRDAASQLLSAEVRTCVHGTRRTSTRTAR
jgi:hypothetical protein